RRWWPISLPKRPAGPGPRRRRTMEPRPARRTPRKLRPKRTARAEQDRPGARRRGIRSGARDPGAVIRPVVELPRCFRLAPGKILGDLDLVETAAAQGGILVGDHVAPGPEPPPVAEPPQPRRHREAAAVGEA